MTDELKTAGNVLSKGILTIFIVFVVMLVVSFPVGFFLSGLGFYIVMLIFGLFLFGFIWHNLNKKTYV